MGKVMILSDFITIIFLFIILNNTFDPSLVDKRC